MSSIDAKYFEAAKDYGRKSYLMNEEDSFNEFMKKKTFFMFDAVYKAPYSEFEKPYFQDSYEEMEQLLQNPPGLPSLPDYPPLSFPDNPSWPSGPQEVPDGGGGFIVFNCSVSGCWCPEDTKEATVKCTHEITGISLSMGSFYAGDFSVSSSAGGTVGKVQITAGKDAEGAVEIDVFMKAGSVRGSHGSIMITECSNCDNCAEAEELAPDSENNPETVSEDHGYVIKVLGGVPPFEWTVDINATLTPITTGRSNYMRVKNNACGGINITVKDACDDETEFSFRIIENGKWQRCYLRNPIDGITCYTCRCGPCFRQNSFNIDANRRLVASCAAIGCDGPEDCTQWLVCQLPEITCEDYYHPGVYYSFPCLDPCGNGGGYTLIGPGYLEWQYWTCNT